MKAARVSIIHRFLSLVRNTLKNDFFPFPGRATFPFEELILSLAKKLPLSGLRVTIKRKRVKLNINAYLFSNFA